LWNVIHIRDSLFYGGPEAIIAGQIGVLSKRGFNFIVTSFTKRNQNNDFLLKIQQKGYSVVPLRGIFKSIFTLVNLIKDKQIHLIICHDYKSNLYGIIAAKLCRKPAISVFHGRTSHSKKMIIYEKFDDKILRLFDGIICVSKSIKNNLIKKGFNPQKLKVIYNAIDIKEIDITIKTPIREELNLPEQSKIVVNIGRISPEKGQYFFIKAAMHVSSVLPNCYFLIIGNGPNLDKLKYVVKKAGYSHRIFFLGFRRDALAILKQSDLLVITSLREGLPLVLLEAFALKVPVLCSPVGGIPEVVSEGITGYLCPPNNTKKLSEKIIHILTSHKNALVIKRAYSLVKEKFSFKNQADKLSQYYLEILNEKR